MSAPFILRLRDHTASVNPTRNSKKKILQKDSAFKLRPTWVRGRSAEDKKASDDGEVKIIKTPLVTRLIISILRKLLRIYERDQEVFTVREV